MKTKFCVTFRGKDKEFTNFDKAFDFCILIGIDPDRAIFTKTTKK